MPGKIFINYRREDTRADAARIRDRLVGAFGASNVFMDVDNLMAGQRFDQELARALGDTDIFLAVMGQRWPQILYDRSQAGGRDYVREEIAQALARGVVVIPVMIERAPLPPEDWLPADLKALVLHHKHDISHDRFGRDVEELVEAIKAARKGRSGGGAARGLGRAAGWLAGGAAALVLAGGGLAYVYKSLLSSDRANVPQVVRATREPARSAPETRDNTKLAVEVAKEIRDAVGLKQQADEQEWQRQLQARARGEAETRKAETGEARVIDAEANRRAVSNRNAAADQDIGVTTVPPQRIVWLKVCDNAAAVSRPGAVKEAKETRSLCITFHERLDPKTGVVLVGATIRQVEGVATPDLLVTVPLGMAQQQPLKISIWRKDSWKDIQANERRRAAGEVQSASPTRPLFTADVKFVFCLAAGCSAQLEATPQLISAMRSGAGMLLWATELTGEGRSWEVPLDGFDSAYSGPPTDSKAHFALRKEMLQQMRQRELDGAEAPAVAPPPPARRSVAPVASPTASAPSGYVAVLRSFKSQVEALSLFPDLQSRYPELLDGKTSDVREVNLGDKGTWYRLRVGPPASREAMSDYCKRFQDRGYKDCFVMPY